MAFLQRTIHSPLAASGVTMVADPTTRQYRPAPMAFGADIWDSKPLLGDPRITARDAEEARAVNMAAAAGDPVLACQAALADITARCAAMQKRLDLMTFLVAALLVLLVLSK